MIRIARTATIAWATFLIGGCSLPGNHPAQGPLPHAAAIPAAAALAPQPAPPAGATPGAVRQAGFTAPPPSGMPAYSSGHTCPPGGCPPTASGAAHHPGGQTGPCTAGCCGTAAPVYPSMPPMSSFGINAQGASGFALDPQEFLCDGGDRLPPAKIRSDDRIIGVDLEDTVVKYATVDGSLHLEPSNRVCIYAPRFASVRKVTGAVTDEKAVAAVGYDLPHGPSDIGLHQPSSAVMAPVGPVHSELARGPDAFRGRDRGVPVENINTPVLAEDVVAVLADLSIISHGILREADKPWLAKGATAAIAWSLDEAVEVVVENVQASVATGDVAAEGLTVYDLPGGRLRVCKLADRQSAAVGDIVTFVLRVDNTGDGKLNDVVLTDNLTTRLEYIEESQTCSKGAIFETEENDGGSLRLTWNFTDDFKVGEAAIIRFRCRVR